MPLYFIRLKLSTLDPRIPYVVYLRHRAAQLRRSVHPAGERGFDAYVLRGGIAVTELADSLGRPESVEATPALPARRSHRVRGFVAAERAGQVGLDLALRVARDPAR